MSATNGHSNKRDLIDRLWDHNPRPDELPYERPWLHIIANDGGADLDWIWPQRLPRGKLSLLVGYPGVGKSMLAADIAARCSAGLPWPDEPWGRALPPDRCVGAPAALAEHDPLRAEDDPGAVMPQVNERRHVLFVSVEDEIEDTIVNRVVSAGRDFDHVALLDRILAANSKSLDRDTLENERSLSFDRDLHHLENALEQWCEMGLLVIDPLLSHCEAADTEQYLRRLLTRVARLAKDHNAAILAVAHLRDDPARTNIYRALGSRALATIPRTIWTVQVDPVRPDRRLLLPLKMNLGKMPAGLSFGFGNDRLVWDSEAVPRMASDPHPSARSVLDEAIQFLRETLAEEDLPAPDVFEQGHKSGFSTITLQRAKETLHVKSRRKGFGAEGSWSWSLPKPRSRQPLADPRNAAHGQNLDPMITYERGESTTHSEERACEKPLHR